MINVKYCKIKPQDLKSFPKIMTSRSQKGIYFFINETTFYCLDSGLSILWNVGDFCRSADIDAFTDYNEPITIQNA